MIKPSDPKSLATDLLGRSICNVQVAAVVWDRHGIHAWGWNSSGDGFGEHAEIAAIRRSNRDRLNGSSIAIAGRRKRNNKIVISFPCADCMKRLQKVGISVVWCQDDTGAWFKARI